MHPRSELVAWSTHPVSRAVSPTVLPSSNMAQCRLSGQVSESGAGGARVKQDLRLLFEAAGSGPVSG